ncbi:TetR/AcrR family transcriptional regulator [Corynebacterium cystitidis]|uniref:Transcriptional regulator, TetR family n=1 Tax=Corynebacterium cystitidis DSM 20524 TaxID=1121357 RepID=A0A1H9WGS6_9CORY|nr:TetR/AcrR family transcriptional regulator [Corynebacterium cystitidis]WJY81863.1 Transcriptional regulator, TetR family [Corynebacterium cystitidis DSM 20524]SES33044.1 transcriptional regulator, TetR family [Corynebacterium cystitidis DSM 20524]SNV82672.1 transcriptional regulator [Corynebacterium cystitidis]
MPAAREEKKAETRARLMRETVKLVLIHGTEGTTVADVASAVGVSARTFHNYFPSREAALEEFVTIRAAAFKEELEKAPANNSLLDTVEAIVLDSFCGTDNHSVDNIVSAFRISTALESLHGARTCTKCFPTLDSPEATIALYGLLAIAWAAVDAYQQLPEPRAPADGEQLLRDAFNTARRLANVHV